MDAKRVGRRVKAFRKLKGFTQIKFANELGVSVSVIGELERGKKQVSEELLNQIATTLVVSKEELTLTDKKPT
ncbi:transcriptional regulator with XRE-family HTH domain [Virgibacillus natechei]|uniref:Transcriptional regulator with XRE-family HTH domain n=1 Tax=Virgibacillus natechei TaxID=1216297 RepID=A0ABS4IHJ1_9BACI|nr:helix-turn-helix transcriptional regulator [Virgibacillus natechei]MBP1970395.1 transcriptional regulator with XRE-family HTH domain [Virgibacillus natechei]UZD13216.1 helix-turn-helix domain-containing protein [Virgibacillus natechei]